MALILARSPFYVNKGNFLDGATVDVIISYINGQSATVNLESYNVVFRGDVSIDISPFIRDFFTSYEVLEIRVIISGTEGQGTITETTNHIAIDGYGYYEEGANKDFTDYLRNDSAFYAGSNDVVYRNRKEPVSIPLLNASSASSQNTIVTSFKKGVVQTIKNVDFGFIDSGGNTYLETKERIQYISDLESPVSFEDRVSRESGVFESKNCYNQYNSLYSSSTIDKIVITPNGDSNSEHTINIIPVCESKYEPYKLVFTNKLGVREDLWFFKKSTNEITTKREEYKANTVQDYISGDLSKHSYGSYNLNGRESMNMNTGFIPESFKENIRQLMLSETVWLDRDGTRLPVTIKNSQMKLKQSINEKLINYEIEIEFSYDTINNIS